MRYHPVNVVKSVEGKNIHKFGTILLLIDFRYFLLLIIVGLILTSNQLYE